MVANLFRKTNLTSWTLSFLSIFLTIYFFQSSTPLNNQETLFEALRALGKSIVVLLLLGIFIYTKRKFRDLTISPYILLSFPLVLLFVPKESIQLDGILFTLFLLLAFFNLSSLERTKESSKTLFNVSLLFTFLTLFEPKLYLLFLTLLFVLALNKGINLRSLITVVTPIVVLNFLFSTLQLAMGFELEPIFWEIKPVVYSLQSSELISYVVFVVWVGGLNFFSKAAQRISGVNTLFFFFMNLIGLGVLLLTIEPQGPVNFYEITLLPLVYFTGLAFEGRSPRQVNWIVFFLLLLKGGLLFYTRS